MTYEHDQPKYIRLAQDLLREIKKGAGGALPAGLAHKDRHLAPHRGPGPGPPQARRMARIPAGFGTVVRSRPEFGEQHVRRGQAALLRAENAPTGRLLDVQYLRATQTVSSLFGVPTRTMVLSRRLLVEADGTPPEITRSFFPRSLVDGTQLAGTDLLDESARQHVEARKKVRYDTVQEEITTRPTTGDEAELLGLTPRSWLLSIQVAARDVTGQVLHVMDVLLPPNEEASHEVYRLT